MIHYARLYIADWDIAGKQLNCFFSNRYEGREDLFEGLAIWESEKYRLLQGTYPVIFLSFAGVKAYNIRDAKTMV